MKAFSLTFFVLAGGILFVYMVFFVQWAWRVHQARKKGIYPAKGKSTLFDVRRLIECGEPQLAVWLYAEIFRCGWHEAWRAVQELARGMGSSKTHGGMS